MRIREAAVSDTSAIRGVCLSAFGAEERDLVARLAADLLLEDTTPPVISLVAEAAGDIVGYLAVSPVVGARTNDLQGYILAPLAVRPEHQRRGIGSSLVADGKRRLRERDIAVLLVYGDPAYYGRFGFSAEMAERYVPPYDIDHPFGWQGVALGEPRLPESPLRIECVASLRDPRLW